MKITLLGSLFLLLAMPLSSAYASDQNLVSRGNASVKDALQVGAAIEEIDTLDLEERMAQTDRADNLLVYANLKRGSENHLRAFVNNLQRQGFEYNPEHLSQEKYDGIISG